MANLEESQRQCQKLMANFDNGKIAAEKEQLEKDVQKLQVSYDYVEERVNECDFMRCSAEVNSFYCKKIVLLKS
jgi:hypothetical protein